MIRWIKKKWEIYRDIRMFNRVTREVMEQYKRREEK